MLNFVEMSIPLNILLHFIETFQFASHLRTMTDCQGFHYCETKAQCFQNHPDCPTSLMCVCDECYYGSR